MTDLTDAYDNAKPGDPAVVPNPEIRSHRWCSSYKRGWYCTRPHSHVGQHVAESDVPAEVVAVWPNEWTKVRGWWCTTHKVTDDVWTECFAASETPEPCRMVPCYIRTEENQR